MSHHNASDDNPLVAAWREQLEHARANPFLLQLLLKQWQRILKRLAYFYATLASLPRRKRRALQRTLATSLIGAAMLLALSSAPVALANSITVSGACTLDEAITNANDDAATFPDCAAGSGPDTIYLTGNVTIGVDTPAAALPDITSEITLEGNNFFVSGANTFRVFYVSSTGDFTINETTVKNGSTGGNGGGIFNAGSLTVTNSAVSGNSASYDGGGIFNAGTLIVTNSTVSGNSAEDGGGIYNYGTLTVTNSTVSGNSAEHGGGIFNYGTLAVTNSTVSGNTANYDGGGIYNNDDATLLLTNSTVSGNSAEDGGGIYNEHYNPVTIANSTISGNTATSDGGGMRSEHGSVVTITNSTFSGNSAGDQGGGIYNESSATLTFNRTIVSGNTATTSGSEIYNAGTVYADNYNLFGNNDAGKTNADAFSNFTPGASDITATSDGTLPTALASILNPTLALNGGTTENHALVSGSPALDKAPNAACLLPPINGIDQRGFPRNVDFVPPPSANDCDIGAFELQAATAVNVTNFTGRAKAGKNILKWRTTSESQIAGFNVFRKNGKGEFKQLNANLKQVKNPGDAQGNKYAFRDKKVKQGKSYRYKVQVLYLDGHHEWTEIVRVKTK